jgi:iron complex outermembrane receptor protein
MFEMSKILITTIAFILFIVKVNCQLFKGSVIDASDSTPLLGATIEVIGSKKLIQSDASGHFIINVNKTKKELKVSYIGYESKIIEIDKQKLIIVKLKKIIDTLDEVIVFNYYILKKIPREFAGDYYLTESRDANRLMYGGIQVCTFQGCFPIKGKKRRKFFGLFNW